MTGARDADLAIRLLAGFEVRVDGYAVDPSHWKLRKASALVKLLALAPRHRLHREALIEVLWPGFGLPAAQRNLNQTVYVARRVLGRDRDGQQRLRLEGDMLVLGSPATAL